MSNTRRRKSTFVSVAPRAEDNWSPALQLERLEQETTLVLQEIDQNLSRANSVINDRMFPILKKYAGATAKVWENVGFWKNFMEEAADVEIKTLDEKLASPEKTVPPTIESPASDYGHVRNSSSDAASRSSSPDHQLEASTPQRPRASLSSRGAGTPQIVAVNRGTAVSMSPKKRTPRRTPRRTPKNGSESDARRSSILQNFLNSSPTLPEPPVLMSELGRMATTSSSSANRPRPGTADSPANRDLGRLSPISFPIATPAITKPAQGSSTQRFPASAKYGSSALRGDSHTATGSPLRRTPQMHQMQFEDDSDLPAVPAPTVAVPTDESDELPVPELQTIQLLKHVREDAAAGRSPKRRRFDGNDPQNVFLDTRSPGSSKNTSTLYHTVAHEQVGESGHSRSMSQLFEEVLFSETRAAQVENTEANAAGKSQSPVLEVSTGAEANSEEQGGSEPGAEEGQQAANASAAPDNTMNSSDLGSFLGERWKALSHSLRK